MIACVYVTGPYGGDEEANTRRTIAAGNDLLAAGLFPYMPHLHHNALLPFTWVRRCDALLRLPGHSAGADREVELATSNGLPVFAAVSEVIEWAAARRRP